MFCFMWDGVLVLKQILKRKMRVISVVLAVLAWSQIGHASPPFATVTVEYEEAARERVWDGRIEAVNQGTVSAQTSAQDRAFLHTRVARLTAKR